ncbi:MAG: hypothetical protein KJ964_08330 [Verrucomicrobia bacterium]|nr:hypothetical protein [Verrucomicrobiota bacterium]MBU1735828.1 hypothetical protein [Verrucomicrobiota bacterium]MBU1857270.1 hypothetical protein [Verrucomicrobiota bacterium]
MPRALLLIMDMVSGHAADREVSPVTGLCYPNADGYMKAGLLPTFQQSRERGVFVRAWNRQTCNTPHGMRYLASGSYRAKASPRLDLDPYWGFDEIAPIPTILSACKKACPEGKVAAFGSDAWMQTGWWKARDCTMGWGSYYSDYLTMQHAFSWMLANPDWKMLLLYLAQYDMTGNCPLKKEGAAYTEDKHHSLLMLDRYLWCVCHFLQEKTWWDETFLMIGSDHGCHVGCDVAVKEGRTRGIPEPELKNYCSNHEPPYDCVAWDFQRNRPTDIRADDCRRTLFMIGGGALPKVRHGQEIPEAEIIDFAPTTASLLGIPMETDGKPLL